MDDLRSLRRSVEAFANEHARPLIPAVPAHDVGPELCLTSEGFELASFLEVARQLYAPALYLHIDVFDPGADDVNDPPERLLPYRGEPCRMEVAFVGGGLTHFWEHRASWYAEWEDLIDNNDTANSAADGASWLNDTDCERLLAPTLDALLAMPEFLAAKPAARHRIAKSYRAAHLEDRFAYDFPRLACERADELIRQRYAAIGEQYETLARQLLADPAYQRARSADVRKQAAEQFLLSWSQGFMPPQMVTNEVYAHATALAKTAGKPSASQ